jgi:release factor glutamine methyltransferase
VTDWSEGDITGGRVTIRDVLVDAERRLSGVGIESADVDAAEIVGFVLGRSRTQLFLQDEMNPEHRVRIEQLLARRMSRVPLQHILGTAPFRRLEVEVGPGVFIPRPETEIVTEAAIRFLPDTAPVVVDLCAGTGAISLAIATEVPGARVFAVEFFDDALVWTRRNVDRFQDAISAAGSQVEVIPADVATVADPGNPLAHLAGCVDVVVCNPPYIPAQMVPREPEVRDYEPHVALFGGVDGLDIVRQVLRTAAILLRPGGHIVMEHADVQGIAAGAAGVPGVMTATLASDELSLAANIPIGTAVWAEVHDRPDLNGLPRFTMAKRTAG